MSITAPPPPEVLRVGTDEIAIHVTSAASAGTLLAADVRMPAGGGPPMLHRHAATEVYRVQEGELTFYLGQEDGTVTRRREGAGVVVHIAGEQEHTIRNESPAAASAYVVYAGGAEVMERFARAAAALAETGPPTVEAVLAIADRHGVETTRPVPRSG